MIKNCEGYNDPTVNAAFASMAKEMSDYEINAMTRIKHLMKIVRYTANEMGFDIEERVVLRDKKTGKVWR